MTEEISLSIPHRVVRKGRRLLRDWRRLQLRRSVAFTAPSPGAELDTSFSPHMLVCHRDFLLAVCSAKALNLASGIALPWIFHDDGSLTQRDKTFCTKHFPGCRLIERSEADRFYEAVPEANRQLRALRKRALMLLKVADVYVFARKERILYCDSDVLFVRYPEFILEKLNNPDGSNYFNKDVATCYISDPSTIRELTGVQPPERINAGLSILNRASISLDKIEGILQQLDPGKRTDWYYYNHLIEQTVTATLSGASGGGARYLPADYDVVVDKPIGTSVAKHYPGEIRHHYELEGLEFLIRERAFFQRWENFVAGRQPG